MIATNRKAAERGGGLPELLRPGDQGRNRTFAASSAVNAVITAR